MHALLAADSCLAQPASHKLVIAGAGPSTEITDLLAKEFCRTYPEYLISVPPQSIKHAGGLAWATKQKQIFGRLGRPITPGDLKKYPSACMLPIARVLIGFGVHKNIGINTLSLDQLKRIMLGEINNWKEIGGKDKTIIRLGREQGEAALTAICSQHPFFEQVQFLKNFNKDHETILAMRKVPGAIGFAETSAMCQFPELAVLEIEGVSCGLDVGLVYDIANENTAPIKLMNQFVQSPEWQAFLDKTEFYCSIHAWKDGLSDPMKTRIRECIEPIEIMASNPLLIAAIQQNNAQNTDHSKILEIDEAWIANGQGDLAESLQSSDTGRFLTRHVADSKGSYTEAILCDQTGAIVALHPRSSDYWQGDEAKFTAAFNNGQGRVHVDDLTYDQSTFSYSVHVSVPVIDNSQTIGVLIMGIRQTKSRL